jgi:hypothetical protein
MVSRRIHRVVTVWGFLCACVQFWPSALLAAPERMVADQYIIRRDDRKWEFKVAKLRC